MTVPNLARWDDELLNKVSNLVLIPPWKTYSRQHIEKQSFQQNQAFKGRWGVVAEARDAIGSRWLFVDGWGNNFAWDQSVLLESQVGVCFMSIFFYGSR